MSVANETPITEAVANDKIESEKVEAAQSEAVHATTSLDRTPTATAWLHNCTSAASISSAGDGDALDLLQEHLPGIRYHEGRESTIEDVRDVITLLNEAAIPACVIGVNALRYFGAGRVTAEWDICVPDESLDDAAGIFSAHEAYKRARPPPMVPYSLRHLHPAFQLRAAELFFILTPSSRCCVDPRPEHCERSNKGIPYPQMAQFARSLLIMQAGADLEDFVDGMDLDVPWAEANMDFADLQQQARAFCRAQNPVLEEKGLGQFNETLDRRGLWESIVRTKEKRIDDTKEGRYKTRWRRIKNDVDPRTRDREM
ncbi:hypothetical protein HYQ45_006880 [Verticillium longisporum]|uniref:Uncharacterized protein n=1 Tax=Verticillium longisporum TaxID=100787 RepID=A0A8I3AQP2_VERLO|nr:hypothetical protein HYQ45_006880 [Verticillium longisporum]